MNNPGHKQKKSQDDDAPQWYIDACLEAVKYGLGVVVIRFDGTGFEAEHIPPERHKELTDALEWAKTQRMDH